MGSAIPEFLVDFTHNATFWAAFLAWLMAQCTKMFCDLVMTRRIRLQHLVSIGGMPSAHAAMVSGLATSIGWHYGWNSPVLALAVGFAALTMFDASTVRRAAGQQARLLNEMIDELFAHRRFSEEKLREFLGHTRLEIFMGMVIGILVALIVDSCAVLMTTGRLL